MRVVFRRALAIAVGGLLAPTIGAAQTPRGNVSIVLPASAVRNDTLISVTPTLVVQATNFSRERPLRITLEVDSSPRFDSRAAREFETTITSFDSTVTIAPVRALFENRRAYFRATVTDPLGITGTSAMIGPVLTPAWVTPVSPPVVIGQPVYTRRPRFVWRRPAINEPPGPWQYTITITNIGRNQETPTAVGNDTTFVPATDLEANAFYRWSITATLPRTNQQTIVPNPVDFVVVDSTVPTLTTSFSPPFPNPFPNATSEVSCLWFDLRAPSAISIDVYDLRGVHVRRVAPNAQVSGVLRAGPYGRGRTDTNEGCDGRFAWDGVDDHGKVVPEGVYMIRFRGDGREFTRKVLFQGRH